MTEEYDPHCNPENHIVYLSGCDDSPKQPRPREGRRPSLTNSSDREGTNAILREGRRPSLTGTSTTPRLVRSRTLSRDRSMSRSPTPSARRPAPNRSTVWSNDSMTSFRVSRRSIAKSHLELGDTSHSRGGRGSARFDVGDFVDCRSTKSRSDSADGDRDFLQESAGTLIIDEGGAIKGDPLEQASSSSGSDSRCRKELFENHVKHGSAHGIVENSMRRLQEHSVPSIRRIHEGDDEIVQDEKPGLWKVRLAMFRIACGNLVNSTPVQVFMSILILTNAIILGAITYDSVRNNPQASSAIEGADLGILVAFTMEITLHFVYLGHRLFSDSWLTFDFVVVVLSWSFLDSPASVLRSLRIFRVFSLVSRWESLRTLFEAIGNTIPKMASIWASLLIFFYVFCVLFTTVFHSLYDEGFYEEDYFGALDKTFVTLFQVMTLDNWSDVARATMEYNPWSFLGFFFFVLFTSFFVVNLVVAVICESLIQISRGSPSHEETSVTDLAVPQNENDDDEGSGFASEGNEDRLEDLMRQLLKNQLSMAASIQELQREVKSLKAKDE